MNSELLWYVAHTRPRCEKKLAQFCAREGLGNKLPFYQAVHKYRGKKVTFEKPLFPGYLFLNMAATQKQLVFQNNYVANLIEVFDQRLFERQLADIFEALDSGLQIQLAPEIGEGTQVRVKAGPLRGMTGWVEKRYGMSTVLLRLDFIGQAAAVKLEADELEPA